MDIRIDHGTAAASVTMVAPFTFSSPFIISSQCLESLPPPAKTRGFDSEEDNVRQTCGRFS